MAEATPYDPLDYENLTINLVRELMTRGPFSLPLPESFPGPGVYALFYNGRYTPYKSVCSPDAVKPIYVGKAVPPGARKGGAKQNKPSPSLYGRIKKHADSIKSVNNLKLSEFSCRYLTVVPLWITMAERFLIEHYTPIWNVCIEGFGLNDPGSGRHQGMVSWWDALHPGRPWAAKLKQQRSADDALKRLRAFLAGQELVEEIDDPLA